MAEKTITHIAGVREVDTKNGPRGVVNVSFADGSTGGAWCGIDEIPAFKASLEALLGQPAELDLEYRGEYKGNSQFTIKSWPGRPADGGRRSGGTTARETVVGGGMTDEQAALIAAASVFTGPPSVDILRGTAQTFLEILRSLKDSPPAAQPSEAGSPGGQEATGKGPAPSGTTSQPEDAPASLPQIAALKKLALQLGMDHNESLQLVTDKFGFSCEAWTQLTKAQAAELISDWNAWVKQLQEDVSSETS